MNTTVAASTGTMTEVQGITFRSDMTVELIKHAATDADVIWAARVSTKGEQSLADVDADPIHALPHSLATALGWMLLLRGGQVFGQTGQVRMPRFSTASHSAAREKTLSFPNKLRR